MNNNPYVMGMVRTVTLAGGYREPEKVKLEMRPDGSIMTSAFIVGFHSWRPSDFVHHGYRLFLSHPFPVKGCQRVNYRGEYWQRRIVPHHVDRMLVEESAWQRLLKKSGVK